MKHSHERLITLYKKFVQNPLTLILVIYIISILLIGAWRNFPLNDDFYFFTQVKAFSLGIFTKSAITNPTFVLQGLMGLLWSKLFGLGYNTLRVLTIIITVFSIVGMDKVLKELGIRSRVRFVALLLITFNPIFYASSLTFMTENCFLFFVIWSLYYFLLFIRGDNWKFLLISSIIGGLSIIIRQFGVVVFVTYLAVYIFTKRKKVSLKEILYIIIPFLLLGCAGIFWPKFKYLSDPKSIDMELFFTSFQNIVSRLTSILILPYIGFFLIPFTIPIFIKLSTRLRFLALTLALPLSIVFFNLNIFKIGNLIYLEGLYARLLVTVRENLFNNVPFKVLVSYLVAVSVVLLVFYLIQKLLNFTSKKKFPKIPEFKDSTELTILVLILGFYLIAVVSDKFYDRYLVNFFIFLVVYAAYRTEKDNPKPCKASICLAILISLMIYLMAFDYYKCMQLKWKLADNLVSNQKVDSYQIFLDGVYVKTVYMEMNKNYYGSLGVKPQNYFPICIVQEYTKQNSSLFNAALTYIESRGLVKKYFPVKYIEYAGLYKEHNRKYNPLTDTLFYNEEYPSPVYNLLGRSIFVRAFCPTDFVRK